MSPETETETLLPVELTGGPFDGHRDEVALQPEMLDRYLFESRADGWVQRVSYIPAHRTTRTGKRWLLAYDCIVSRQKLTGQ